MASKPCPHGALERWLCVPCEQQRRRDAAANPFRAIRLMDLMQQPGSQWRGFEVTPRDLRGWAEHMVTVGWYSDGSEIVCWLRHVANLIENEYAADAR